MKLVKLVKLVNWILGWGSNFNLGLRFWYFNQFHQMGSFLEVLVKFARLEIGAHFGEIGEIRFGAPISIWA